MNGLWSKTDVTTINFCIILTPYFSFVCENTWSCNSAFDSLSVSRSACRRSRSTDKASVFSKSRFVSKSDLSALLFSASSLECSSDIWRLYTSICQSHEIFMYLCYGTLILETVETRSTISITADHNQVPTCGFQFPVFFTSSSKSIFVWTKVVFFSSRSLSCLLTSPTSSSFFL